MPSRHAIAWRAVPRLDAPSACRAVQQPIPHCPADRLQTHQNPHDDSISTPAGQCTHPTRKTGLLISARVRISCTCHKHFAHNRLRKTRQRTIENRLSENPTLSTHKTWIQQPPGRQRDRPADAIDRKSTLFGAGLPTPPKRPTEGLHVSLTGDLRSRGVTRSGDRGTTGYASARFRAVDPSSQRPLHCPGAAARRNREIGPRASRRRSPGGWHPMPFPVSLYHAACKCF